VDADAAVRVWHEALAQYSVVEGRAAVSIEGSTGSRRYEVGPKDHFVVPPWHTLSLQAGSDCVLFGYSDSPLQEAAGLLREEAL
jgi:gentisate 1,2-dioxygenase